MTVCELLAISPLIVLAGSAVAILLLPAFYRNHALAAEIALAALAIAMTLLLTAVPHGSNPVGTMLLVDGQAMFLGGLIIASAFCCALLATGRASGEFYVFLLLATLGAAAMTACVHAASFFLSLELLGVSLYSMIVCGGVQTNRERKRAGEPTGRHRRVAEGGLGSQGDRLDQASGTECPLPYGRGSSDRVRQLTSDGTLGVEAGIKYMVLAGVSSAILLFGLAVLYAQSGTMDLLALAAKVSAGDALKGFLPALPMLAGAALVLAGVGFKLALVPFHLWTADVYQGAPAPVTAFIATVSKGAVFAVLLRFAGLPDLPANAAMNLILFVVAVASMAVGNLLALWQNDLKRMLAYSSISHMGYLLVALLAGGNQAGPIAAFYLTTYFAAIIGAFGVVGALDGGEDYRGLYFRRPALAVILTISLLSLAGLPVTAGFMGKFLLLRAGLAGGQLALVIVLIAASGVGLFYYMRIALAMFDRGPAESSAAPRGRGALPATVSVVLWPLAAVLIAVGVMPDPLLRLIAWVLR